MHELWDSIHQLIDAERLLKEGGFYVLLFVVFAETGLFFGFFLPGDYLLFLAGMFVATDKLDTPIAVVIAGLILAAILGNFVGYWFGKKTGDLLYNKEDSFFFKKQYLMSAQEYYNKQGAFALIVGRFIPIVRTFAPIVAGMIKVNIIKFAIYNVVGAVAWIVSLTLLGYVLGTKFEEQVNDYLAVIIAGFVIITAIPLVWTYLKSRVLSRKTN